MVEKVRKTYIREGLLAGSVDGSVRGLLLKGEEGSLVECTDITDKDLAMDIDDE